MQKSIYALAIIPVIGGIYFAWQKTITPSVQKGDIGVWVGEGQGSTFRVSYTVDQKPEGHGSFSAYNLAGQVLIYKNNDGNLVTQWAKVDRFEVVNTPVNEDVIKAMVDNPALSSVSDKGVFEHFIGDEFPGRYLGLQLSLLDKTFFVQSKPQDEVVHQKERDEFGLFNVEYSYAKNSDASYIVNRRWTQSLDNKNIVDAKSNGFRYTFSSDGRLQKVDGELTVSVKTQGSGVNSFVFRFTMDEVGQSKVPPQELARSLRDLPKADLGRAEVESRTALSEEFAEEALPSVKDFADALQRSDTYRADSPGSEQQEIFTTIKLAVMANPSEAGKVYEKILGIKGDDDDSQARSSLLFGALTSTNLPEVADAFVDMAKSQCPNDLCRIQALTSLNIHDNPSGDHSRSLLSIAHSASSEDIANAAYLAAGSVASKVSGDTSDVTQALLRDFEAAKDDRKISVVQAMGNHGAPEYLPILQSQAKSEDTFEKSSALYALRSLQVEGATQTLLSSLDTNGSDIVNIHSLRALAQKPLAPVDQIRVAEAFTASEDNDVQAAVTDLLLNNYRANVDGSLEALQTFKDKTPDVAMKSYLEEAMEEIKKDKEKDHLYE